MRCTMASLLRPTPPHPLRVRIQRRTTVCALYKFLDSGHFSAWFVLWLEASCCDSDGEEWSEVWTMIYSTLFSFDPMDLCAQGCRIPAHACFGLSHNLMYYIHPVYRVAPCVGRGVAFVSVRVVYFHDRLRCSIVRVNGLPPVSAYVKTLCRPYDLGLGITVHNSLHSSCVDTTTSFR